jgi:hypothetical protein
MTMIDGSLSHDLLFSVVRAIWYRGRVYFFPAAFSAGARLPIVPTGAE